MDGIPPCIGGTEGVASPPPFFSFIVTAMGLFGNNRRKNGSFHSSPAPEWGGGIITLLRVGPLYIGRLASVYIHILHSGLNCAFLMCCGGIRVFAQLHIVRRSPTIWSVFTSLIVRRSPMCSICELTITIRSPRRLSYILGKSQAVTA